MASSGFLVVIPFRFKTQNTKVSSRKTQRREPWEQGWKKSRFLVATHNQMTLILRKPKIHLIHLFTFQILLSMSLAEVEAHIIVFYLIII